MRGESDVKRWRTSRVLNHIKACIDSLVFKKFGIRRATAGMKKYQLVMVGQRSGFEPETLDLFGSGNQPV